jgi:hypothetical protein
MERINSKMFPKMAGFQQRENKGIETEMKEHRQVT